MSAVAQKRSVSPTPAPNQFVVTVLDGHKKILWSTIWGGHGPLGVGFPFEWVLERRQTGVRVRHIGTAPDRVVSNPTQEYDFDSIEDRPIPLSTGRPANSDGQLWLNLAPVRSFGDLRAQIAETGWVPEPMADSSITENQTDPLFKKTAGLFTGLLLVAWFATLFIPAPKKTEELIPPQFAKTLLSPLNKDKGGSSPAAAGKVGGGQNLVMAFKSEVVKKTTKALLNAGATKALLNTSSLLDGAATSNLVRKVFDGKGPRVGTGKGIDPRVLLGNDSSKIGFLGGKGKGGQGGGSADYGTGRGAAVAGQGTSQLGISPEGAGVSEGLTKDEVGLVIRKHLDEVRYCYESALVRSPGFEGKLLAAFTIAATGRVKVATPKESSGDPKLDSCITGKLLNWDFPKPRGGVDVGVSYPFIFKSLGN